MSALPLRKHVLPKPTVVESPFQDWARSRCVPLTITPAEASELLTHHNGHNRSFTEKLIVRLTAELKEGRWTCNGETLIFDWDGQLLDGQHRLAACVRSGMPITTHVMFGIDPAAFTTIDRGRSRTVSDDLSIEGEKSVTALAAALSLLYWHEIGELNNNRISSSARTDQCMEMLETYPAIRDSVRFGLAHYRKLRIATRAAAFLHFQFSRKDPAAAEVFFVDLMAGANLAANDPVLVLRNRLFGQPKSKSKLTLLETMALTIKAWNYRRKHRTITSLRWRHEENETFPTIQ